MTGAGEALRTAMLVALRADPVLGQLNGVLDGPGIVATPPFVQLGAMLAVDWGFKDRAGRELRTAVTIHDRAATPQRIGALASGVESVVADMPRDLPGWRIASCVFVRAQVSADRAGAWRALVEHRVRMMEVSQ